MCIATNAVSRKTELTITMCVEVVNAIGGGSWKWRTGTGLSEGRRQGLSITSLFCYRQSIASPSCDNH